MIYVITLLIVGCNFQIWNQRKKFKLIKYKSDPVDPALIKSDCLLLKPQIYG